MGIACTFRSRNRVKGTGNKNMKNNEAELDFPKVCDTNASSKINTRSHNHAKVTISLLRNWRRTKFVKEQIVREKEKKTLGK